METFFTYLVKALLLPPAANLLLLLLARLTRRRPHLSRSLAVFAIASLYVTTTPLGAMLLASGLETAPPFVLGNAAMGRIGAIVVPGSGRYSSAPEFASDTVSVRTLERLRYAARVHRATGWPIATIGGMPFGEGKGEGELMADTLRRDFAVEVRWIENRSRNTAENASNAREVVDVQTILLVTQAMDMPRARTSFEAAGFEVIPGPIGFISHRGPYLFSVFDLIPDADALITSTVALHEYLGQFWYRLRYAH